MKTLFRFIIVLMCTAGFLGPTLHAATGGDVLAMSISPRAIAVGGAYTALAEDVQSALYNPAGLTSIDNLQFGFIYNTDIVDSVQYFSLARPIKIGGVLGGSVIYRSVPTIDNEGAVDDPVDANDVVVALSYGRKIIAAKTKEATDLSMGVNFKWIRSILGSYEATTVAFDLGALWRPDFLPNGQFGVSIQNLGMAMKYIEEEDQLPIAFKLGTLYKLLDIKNHDVKMMLDVNVPLEIEALSVNIGSEYWFSKIVAVRAGYQYQKDSLTSTFYAGIGGQYKVKNAVLKLDYAFKPVFLSSDNMETNHSVALTLGF